LSQRGKEQEKTMRISLTAAAACLLATPIPAAFANGGGGMSMPQRMPEMRQREQTPQDKAREAFNDGVRWVKKADKAQSASLEAKDARKKDKAAQEAQDLYGKALARFREAAGYDSSLPEAWNYVGYTSRKLGKYDDALEAYEKALKLKPGYADALEYRGEAYLGMSRIQDAQQAYLDLYAGNRALAGKLLSAMKSWLETQRTSPSGGAVNLDELDKWIQERAQIAGQTAALTREGTAASWR
jgi:tetratricopeptide (TPR) repeat protein